MSQSKIGTLEGEALLAVVKDNFLDAWKAGVKALGSQFLTIIPLSLSMNQNAVAMC